MDYELNIATQVISIIEKFDYKRLNEQIQKNSSNVFKDFIDSEIYQAYISTIKHMFKDNRLFLSFTLNTDGISISEKSKLSLWPIYLIINEIPVETRFSFNNIIIAGINEHNQNTIILK